MKYINLFLALSVILCYGFSGSVNRPCAMSSNMHQDEISITVNAGNSYSNLDAVSHEPPVCQYALLNAPHSNDLDSGAAFLYLVAADLPTLEIDEVPDFLFDLTLKKEYRPPDLFLTKSSFLL